MMRWKGDLDRTYEGRDDEGAASDRATDGVHYFFLLAYHLADWLQNSGINRNGKSPKQFAHEDEHLRIARDLANGAKHMRLDPRQSPMAPDTRIGQKDMHVRIGGERPGTSHRFQITWTGAQTDEWIDAQQLADACIEAWKDYLGTEWDDPA